MYANVDQLRDLIQFAVNTMGESATTRNYIRHVAAQEHAEWPQYRGHWDADEWKLVKVRKRIKTKLGIAFMPDDLAIARWVPAQDGEPGYYQTYSIRNGVDTGLQWGDVTYEFIPLTAA